MGKIVNKDNLIDQKVIIIRIIYLNQIVLIAKQLLKKNKVSLIKVREESIFNNNSFFTSFGGVTNTTGKTLDSIKRLNKIY